MKFASELLRRAWGLRTRWAILAVFLALFAVFLTTAFFFVRTIRLEESASLAENRVLARGVAAFIEAREHQYLIRLEAYGERSLFQEAVKRRDRPQVLRHLRQLYDSLPGADDRPFVADREGVGWAIYPDSPENYGKSLAHMDWYRGVSQHWRSYVSEVFQMGADGPLVVALVVPVRDMNGGVIGILGVHQRLETIRHWLLPVQIPGGDLFVVDGKGRLVFHRTRTGPSRFADYAGIPAVRRVLGGQEGVAELENPVEGDVRLVAYQPLPSLGWGLVVQRSKDLALQRTRNLILVSVAAGSILTITLAVLGVIALRRRQQTLAALAALAAKTRALQGSEEKFRSVTQSAIDAIISADSRGTIRGTGEPRSSSDIVKTKL